MMTSCISCGSILVRICPRVSVGWMPGLLSRWGTGLFRERQAMRILVACEFSGIVRDEFLKRGHDAVSCDLVPTESSGPHIQGDVLDHLEGWDMIIAFPPCTHLARSGAQWHWHTERTDDAIRFVIRLWNAPCPRVAIENPVGALSTWFAKPTQIIQPWMFGHGEVKTTCLWLKNLPRLKPTQVVEGRLQRVWRMPPGPTRQHDRSLTYPGIAKAMAQQWSDRVCCGCGTSDRCSCICHS